MEQFNEFIRKIATQQHVYFAHEFENAVLRSNKKEKNFTVKIKGKEPFTAPQSNDLVSEAILKHAEITKEQYERF